MPLNGLIILIESLIDKPNVTLRPSGPNRMPKSCERIKRLIQIVQSLIVVTNIGVNGSDSGKRPGLALKIPNVLVTLQTLEKILQPFVIVADRVVDQTNDTQYGGHTLHIVQALEK